MFVDIADGSHLERWESALADAARLVAGQHGIDVERMAVTARRLTSAVRWVRLDGDDGHGTTATLWAAQMDGRAPSGAVPVTTTVGEVGVWRHPNDPALPGLRAALSRPDAELVTLDPLDRAVVRIGGQAIVKVMPPGRAPSIIDVHERLNAAGLPVPGILTADPTAGLVEMTPMSGVTLADHLASGGPGPSVNELDELLDRLATVDLERRCTAEPLGAASRRHRDRLGAAHPEFIGRLRAIGQILDDMGAVERVTIHGDLHDHQLLVDPAGRITAMLDVDTAGSGDRLDDIGTLLAAVMCRHRLVPTHTPGGDVWVETMVAGMDRRVGSTPLRASVAHGVLVFADRWRVHAPDPTTFTVSCLDLVEGLLGSTSDGRVTGLGPC